jgi:hypothetical protein
MPSASGLMPMVDLVSALGKVALVAAEAKVVKRYFHSSADKKEDSRYSSTDEEEAKRSDSASENEADRQNWSDEEDDEWRLSNIEETSDSISFSDIEAGFS